MIAKAIDRREVPFSQATSYAQWKEAALRFDKKNRLHEWQQTDRSRLYDYVAIRNRLEELRSLRASRDDHGLLFALNEGIHGNMGGMGRGVLYRKAKFGTKQLIVDYVSEISSALEYLADAKVRKIRLADKIAFFNRASHCFGRSALLLSGAGTLLYFHIGVVKALWEQGVLPSILSGSSGGALVAGVVGTHSSRQLEGIFAAEFLELEARRDVGILKYFSIFNRQQIPQEEIYAIVERLIPDLTFQEAYEATGIQINISVAPADHHQTSRLLNAITSPNVLVREAVIASCAVPGVYPAVTLAARNARGQRQQYLPSRKWVDGSLAQDLPIKRISRLYGVNHSIVSQTNPLILPFVAETADERGLFGIVRHAGVTTAKEWSVAAARVLQKPIGGNNLLNRVLNTFVSVVSQSYTGDINIFPTKRANNPLRALSPRSQREIMALVRDGERATWPKIEMIRIQTTISRVLDEILEAYGHDMVSRVRQREPTLHKSA